MKFSAIVATTALLAGYASAARPLLSLSELVNGQPQSTEYLEKRNVIVITATYNGAVFSWSSTVAGDAGVTKAADDDSTTTITKYVTATTFK